MQIFFLKLLPLFIDFANPDDCIGKITSKFIGPNLIFICIHVYISITKIDISSEKMKNSSDYAHSFFGEDF